MLTQVVLYTACVWSAFVAADALATPAIKLDSATFSGSTTGRIESFLGIPFAEPPTGANRFRLPQTLQPYTGTYNASTFGHSCPQHAFVASDLSLIPPETLAFFGGLLGNAAPNSQSEDCLTVNVIRPAGMKKDAKLPVVVWIYGGAFQIGGSYDYNGTAVVDRSIALRQPIIYVSLNYRVAGFGFMPGTEIKQAGVGNLGLHDQRAALRWVKKYISQFGGDPTKTTIWGQSAGAVSAVYQMVTNNANTEGLFRGAFMQSGAAWSVGPIERGQQYYDGIVGGTGCTDAVDTLDCLRQVPFAQLKAEMDKVPALFSQQGLAITFGPQIDGVFLKENPFELVKKRKVARIPVVQGNCDDEGTVLTLPHLNISTTQQLRHYLSANLLPSAPDADLDKLLALYPEDPALGSPFDTGNVNAITPQYKRIAALLGDVVFQGPRRQFLEELSGRQDAWSYLYKRNKSLPALGSLHTGDLNPDIFAGGQLTDFLVNFVNALDPNGASAPVGKVHWPRYKPSEPRLLTFVDGTSELRVTQDTFRQNAMKFLKKFLVDDPL